jgi:two-component system chemotaxis response regulator CheY
MRAILLHALTEHGFKVDQAEHGLAALDWLKDNEPDVIITDINMPKLDGFGLIERLRADGRHGDRPILVLSTESADEMKARARAAGATGWIVKPFDAVKLASAIRRVCD